MSRPVDVAVIGLGAMGLPIARNLVAAGLDIVGVEPSPERRAAANDFPVVGGLADCPESEIVLVMVASPEQLTAVVDSAAESAVATSTWIISGTVGPDAVSAQAQRLQRGGARVVDAPVTGGVAGAVAATLTLFVSGGVEDIATAMPVLQALGSPETVGTDLGDGQVMKLINQHLCTVHLAAAAEALSLAGRLGLDRDRALDLLGRGGAASWMLADRGPRMLARPGTVNSSVDIFVKDSHLVQEAAAHSGAPVPILETAASRFDTAHELGLGTADDAQIITVYDADGGASRAGEGGAARTSKPA